MKLILSILALSGFLWSCTYDSEEQLYHQNGNCDTSAVRYSTTITSLLNNYGCISCHNAGTFSGSIRLDTYTSVKARVDDGQLFGAINHLPGFTPMPESSNKMSPCDLGRVNAWIAAGAPNN
jgi:formate-dependent nitrite reductase cytochrome c552 subunit